VKDEEYVFMKTASERKRNGWGAFNKKGGSRRKGCSLPSDNLTAKQRKELNGVVETLNTMKIYTWDEFKRLPNTLKEEYLKILYEHGARALDIAEMWGKGGASNLRVALSAFGIDNAEMAKKSPQYRKQSQSVYWLKFLEDCRAMEAAEVSTPTKEENAAPEPSGEVKLDVPEIVRGNADVSLLKVISGTLNYEGDPAAIFEKVMLAIDPSKKYKMQIRFQVYDY
jgi:hypothetical protein